ncbi:MAG TPA: methylmalonyl-CoA mutase family protein [Candidatus Cloacimonadota bacterium]|nr:methylmalonyl-CoA mutase family protein [Candidatus Cloacimonadota bacterium]
METKEQLNLKQDFPSPSVEEWKKTVIESLKGADYDKVMHSKTYEGITLEPIYRYENIKDLPFTGAMPGAAPFHRGNDPQRKLMEGWKVAQAHSNPDPKALNKELLEALSRGLSMVNLHLKHSDRTDGVSINNVEDFTIILHGIDLKAAPLFIQTDLGDPDIFAMLEEYCSKNGIELKALEGAIGCDPTGEFARKGATAMPLDDLWQKVLGNLQTRAQKAPKMPAMIIDGTVYEAAGASATQELAYVLATAIGYIHGLTASGMEIDIIAPLMAVKLSLGSNFFMEIAKVRAFRLLWAEMIKAWGGNTESQKVWIHGKTATFNKSTYDLYVNMLRTTTEAFSGVIGGVDSLEVDRFDTLVNAPGEFASRIARNQQLILAEEAHFTKVLDPAGGCYYIESLTQQLADKAWNLMQEIDSEGGMVRCLISGKIHEQLAVSAKARIDAAHTRKDVFVGVNMYANPADTALQIREAGDQSENVAVSLSKGALPKTRAVARLEALRASISESKEKIFLITMGSIAEYKARADFASGFFAVGGFDVISGSGYSEIDEAVAAARASGAKAFCICSTDENYENLVAPLCEKLGKYMILAGYPKDKTEEYSRLGIDLYIHIRANLYDTLRDLAQKLGVNL